MNPRRFSAIAVGVVLLALGAAGGLLAAAERPVILVNGRAVKVNAAEFAAGGEPMLWLRDLDRLGLGKTEWDSRTGAAALITPGMRIEFRAGDSMALVTSVPHSGRPVQRRQRMTRPAVLSAGRLMVPLLSMCRQLAVTVETPAPSVINLVLPANVPPGSSAPARAGGVVAGRVLFGGRPLPGVVLRLVRDADSTFVGDLRARTDAEGRYHFVGVSPGRYRSYAYVEDNPDYFNRETAPFVVGESEVVAPTISMGRVIRPVRPRSEARVTCAEHLSFEWSDCAGAASYEFSVVDPETHEEVAFSVSRVPHSQVPGSAFALGRHYHCQVLALTESGDPLGATPGMGAQPWSIIVVATEVNR